MQDLIIEIQELRKELNQTIELEKKRGLELAKAERNYRVELAKKILLEREKGTPVTIMSDVCRGDERIADLKFKRDTAAVLYKSAGEKINGIKLELRIVYNQVEAERRGE